MTMPSEGQVFDPQPTDAQRVETKSPVASVGAWANTVQTVAGPILLAIESVGLIPAGTVPVLGALFTSVLGVIGLWGRWRATKPLAFGSGS